MPVHKLLHRADRRTPSPVMSVSSPSPPAPAPATSSVSKYPRFGKRGAPQAFPSKLYEILEGENPDIVGWTATGRGFEVRDHARLSSEVLGRFFKQDKFSSFQRQLNLYGFRKITKGSESGSYQHPHFRRGERTTLLTIRRSTKASPARVAVPVSPASAGAGTPLLAVPLGNGSDVSTVSNNNGAKQPRSATPSPPPAAVSRGALPWPRPPALVTGAALQQQQPQQSSSGAREVSPNGSTKSNADDEAAAAGSQAQGGDRWGSYPGLAAPVATAADHNPAGGAQQKRQWDAVDGTEGAGGEGAAKAQSALDQNDVEVVSLLQRMAKEAQDSPSRKRAALAAQQWEGARVQAAASSSSTSSSQQQQQQRQFQMPRSVAAGSGQGGQAQQTVFEERLYDMLSHDRVGGAAARQPTLLSLAFGADGRAQPGFPQQHQQQSISLNSPFATTATTASTPSSSSSSSPHLPQPPSLDGLFESVESAHRCGAGGGGEGDGEPGVNRMVMTEQDRQVLLARSRSGPSSSAAERDRQVQLARSRSGPTGLTHEDEQHYHRLRQQQQQQQQQHGNGFMYDHSANRSAAARGGFSFGNTRFGRGPPSSSGALPPLPSLNFEQLNVGSSGSSGGGGGAVGIHRGPWYGAESSYPPSSIGSYVN